MYVIKALTIKLWIIQACLLFLDVEICVGVSLNLVMDLEFLIYFIAFL
jgi:hypothetical protein